MAEYLIQDTTLTAIGNAIRTKTKKTDSIPVTSLADEISSISSGGDELNFEVVGGTTKPSNPTVNTIWVNTSTSISSWIFSAGQPSNPVGGMVWITTNTSSTMKFNALKNNDIQIHLASVKQYVGSAWETKNAFCYQSGTWTQFSSIRMYYYNRGDLCTANSGGWGYNYSSNVAFNTDHILLTGINASKVFAHGKTCVPLQYKTMYIVGEVVSTADNGTGLEETGLTNANFVLTAGKNYGTVGAFTLSIDISAVTVLSNRWAVVRVGSNTNCKAKIYEVYFE